MLGEQLVSPKQLISTKLNVLYMFRFVTMREGKRALLQLLKFSNHGQEKLTSLVTI